MKIPDEITVEWLEERAKEAEIMETDLAEVSLACASWAYGELASAFRIEIEAMSSPNAESIRAAKDAD